MASREPPIRGLPRRAIFRGKGVPRRGADAGAGGLAGPCRRVLRGGSWLNNPRNLRSANRNRNDVGNRNDNVGFRLASTLRGRSRRGHGRAGRARERPGPSIDEPAPPVLRGAPRPAPVLAHRRATGAGRRFRESGYRLDLEARSRIRNRAVTMPQGAPVEAPAGAARLRERLLEETGRDCFVHVLASVGQPMAAQGRRSRRPRPVDGGVARRGGGDRVVADGAADLQQRAARPSCGASRPGRSREAVEVNFTLSIMNPGRDLRASFPLLRPRASDVEPEPGRPPARRGWWHLRRRAPDWGG